MKRSDVRLWLHQAALDAAQLAERRQAGRPEQRASLARARHGSLLEGERDGCRLCPERSADHVPRGREFILQSEFAALRSEATEHAISEALRLAHQALRAIDQGHVQAMHDLLRGLHLALRHAHAFVQESDCGRQPSSVLTTLLCGAL